MYELLILLLIFIDQISKVKIKAILGNRGSIPIIDGFFNLTYVENRGAAFGLFQDKQMVFVLVALVVVIVGLGYIHKL